MRGAAFLMLAALVTACTVPVPPAPGYRDQSVPLSYTTRGTAKDMAGSWFVRGYFPGGGGISAVSFLSDRPDGAAVEMLQSVCDSEGNCEAVSDLWDARRLGPHRWALTSPSGEGEMQLWVIWVDEGYRTAAIGTPDGSYGWVLDRRAKGGADRIKAATEILDFNGYNTGAMILR